MATKKRTSSASGSRSNSYANLRRAKDQRISNLEIELEKQACDKNILLNLNKRLTEDADARTLIDQARPFRSIIVHIRDGEGRMISSQDIFMNKGDRVDFGVSPEGYVTTKADREIK